MSGPTPWWVTALALVVALISLAFSIYNIMRDRGRLRATSNFFPPDEYGDGGVRIVVVNHGRRTVILPWLYFDDLEGGALGSRIEGGKPDLRLGEHERHELVLHRSDLYQHTPMEDIDAVTMWFEDTLGRKHKIKGIEENIRLLKAVDSA